jgi:hypothetical protein
MIETIIDLMKPEELFKLYNNCNTMQATCEDISSDLKFLIDGPRNHYEASGKSDALTIALIREFEDKMRAAIKTLHKISVSSSIPHNEQSDEAHGNIDYRANSREKAAARAALGA